MLNEAPVGPPATGAFDTLLAPFPAGDFFERCRDRSPFHVARGEPDRYRSVLDLDTVERYVFEANPREKQLQVLREGGVDRSEYLYPSGLVDAVSVGRLFEEGCSVVLPHAHEHVPALGALVRALEVELGCRVQANVYLAPPDTSAFAAHYDKHDVFALQVHGAKEWTLFDSALPIPATRAFDRDNDRPGEPIERFTLRQGDLCYVPRGMMHRAVAEEVSVHATIGVHWTSRLDVLRAVIERAAEEQADLHGAIPHEWWAPGPARAETIRQSQEVLPGVAGDDLVAGVLDRLRSELVATRQPLVPGQLGQLARIDEIDQRTLVAPRDPILWDLREGVDTVDLSCFGNVISFPSSIREPLWALLTGGEGVVVGDLPGGLEDEEKLVLVRRLIREGVLRACWP